MSKTEEVRVPLIELVRIVNLSLVGAFESIFDSSLTVDKLTVAKPSIYSTPFALTTV